MSYVYEQLGTHDIARALRQDEYAGWSYDGAVALRCDYTETDLEDFQREYGEDYETIEDIEERTTVIPVRGDRFIYQAF